MNQLLKISLATLAMFMLNGCVGGGMPSPKQENSMGKQQAQQILSKVKLSQNRQLNTALRNVGRRIASVSHKANFDWKYYLVDNSKQANAFVLPGGKVFVYTGLFKHIANEAELAAVIGHEVAHALRSHGVKSASRRQKAGLIGALLQVGLKVAGVNNQTAQQANQVYGQSATLGYIRPYSRKNETAADSIGLMLMASAGYDPRAALTFWNKFGKQGHRIPEYQSTHPAPSTRIQNIRKLMPQAISLYKKSRMRRR